MNGFSNSREWVPMAAFELILVLGFSFASVHAQDRSLKENVNRSTAGQELLFKAAREGDLAGVKTAVDSGVNVDAKTDYGATALFFACDRGHEEIVKFLLENGSDPNAQDTFYKATPMTWAQSGNQKIVLLLLENGGEGADAIFNGAIAGDDTDYANEILKLGVVSQAGLIKARKAVLRMKDSEKQAKLLTLFEGLKLPEPVEFDELTAESSKKYTGKYQGDRFSVHVQAEDRTLTLEFDGGEKTALIHVGEHEFTMGQAEIRFEIDQDSITGLVFASGSNETRMVRSTATTVDSTPDKSMEEKEAVTKSPRPGPSKVESTRSDLAVSSPNWPGFRGHGARGVADGQNPPIEWKVSGDMEAPADENLKWKTPLAGLGLSCPTIWGDHLYLTTAVSEGDASKLKIGLYGDVDSIEDDREYEFKVLCFSKFTGELIWEKTANKVKPAVKRHAKSSHANPTVAADGEHVVAFFGSEGLFCFSNDGDLLWKKNLGLLDSGWFYDPGYQWGFGSSPIIFRQQVIVQCDIQGQSFVAAFDLNSGDENWRTDRDEIPTWSTPTVHEFGETPMLITGGTKSARGYDVRDGKLLWSLKGHSEIVVPTPFVAHNLIFVASGYSPIQPIYAIRPDARGDISLDDDTLTNASIPWSVKRGGPYMPSPVVYGDYLYCCGNNGILTCYVAETGELAYKERIKVSGGSLSFTASPVAADGHLYLTAEDGRVVVVKAGSEFEVVTVNQCGDSILATPAISEGVIYFRTQDSLIAIGEK